MLLNISWGQFLLTLGVVFALYYLTVAFVYFSKGLKGIFRGRKKTQSVPAAVSLKCGLNEASSVFEYSDDAALSPGSYTPFEQTSDETFEAVENLITKLKQAIVGSAAEKTVKPEFSHLIVSILNQTPELKYSPFRSAIGEMMLSECKKVDYMPLTETEIEELWNLVKE